MASLLFRPSIIMESLVRAKRTSVNSRQPCSWVLKLTLGLKALAAEVVGVYARDSVGKLTQPDTAIHSHIVYSGGAGNDLTAHLEDFAIAKGTRLYLPRKSN